MRHIYILLMLFALISCNKNKQTHQNILTNMQDSDTTVLKTTHIDLNSRIINLPYGFKISAGAGEDFETFKTYFSIILTHSGTLVYVDSATVEYEFGDKLYPILLKTGTNKFELLLEINDRPNKNYLKRITIENEKVLNVDTLPTFESKPSDYDKDGIMEYAGFWDYSEVWGENNSLTAYNPILYYSLTKEGLTLDSTLTIEKNRKIYGDFYGYQYNEKQEMPVSVVKKFGDELRKVETPK